MNWTQEEIEKAFKEVKKKSLTDQAFRALLISNPHKAIEQATGKAVPSAFKIKVVECDPAYQMTFVLPEMITEELSDEALEKVAGGTSCVGIGISAAEACAGAIGDGTCGARACAGFAGTR